ncbi:hypothetical protein F9K50_00790 [bacterium]|nr:MAG: hypothetical protein F9K50_00790 [bacterium]
MAPILLSFNAGMGTAAQSLHPTPTIEEFLDYDSRGQVVVLRRNSEHPGDPLLASAPSEKKSEFRLAPSAGDRSATAGGLGFFSEFQEVRKRLQAQGLLKR